jgi:hypothetical protein
MAREYETTVIDGVTYELHGVKADGKKIGTVPVRVFIDTLAFVNFISSELSDGELELAISDWQYGNAVRLQGMARKATTGEGFNDAAMNKVYAAMSKEDAMNFIGDHTALVKECKKRWAEMQAAGAAEADEDHIWEELL